MEWPWRGPAISKHFDTALIKKTTTVLSAVAVLVSFTGTALADQFDAQITAARQAAAVASAQASQAQGQANTYQDQVNQYQGQANAIQAQINLNIAKSNKLDDDIATATASLAEQKAILSANIKQMYLDSGVTPLEMLVSSQNISDFMNKQQYQDKVKTKIQDSMASILALKTQLDTQQKEVAQILSAERDQRSQVASLLGQANALLAVAQQSAAVANQQVAQQNSQVASLRAQQAAAIAAASRHVSGGAGCGGYPGVWCNAPQDSVTDSWGMYNRECVSYAAWAATERFGHNVPYWGGRGNAKQWPDNARGAGIPVDGSPRIGDVAIYMGGTYGHAMIVESISGGTVRVSSFNSDWTGHYSIDDWPISSLEFIHFQ